MRQNATESMISATIMSENKPTIKLIPEVMVNERQYPYESTSVGPQQVIQPTFPFQTVFQLDSNLRSADAELQQRASEYLALSKIASLDVLVSRNCL